MPKPYIIHNGMMSCHYVKICRRVRKEKGGNNTLRVQYLHVENKLKVGLNKIIISYSISTINVRSYCSNDGGVVVVTSEIKELHLNLDNIT